MKSKEELLKQLDELTKLAKSKGLIKVDPKTKLPGTFMDKSQVKKDQFGPTTQAAVNSINSAFGQHSAPPPPPPPPPTQMKSLDKTMDKDMADKLRAIYGTGIDKEASISANNNPDPSEASKKPEKSHDLGKNSAKEQPINEGTSHHESPLLHNEEKKVEKAQSKHDKCVEEVSKQPGIKNAHAVCVAAGVKPQKWGKSEKMKKDEAEKCLSAAEKCDDPCANIISSLKKGFFLP